MRIRRTGLGVGIAALVIVVVVVPSVPEAVAALGADDFPDALLGLATLALLAVASWLVLVIAAGCAQVALPGVPHTLRAALFTGVVVGATALPAAADPPRDLDGLSLPDRPVAAAPARSVPVAEIEPTVEVRPHDTLWAIAADHLPAHASIADVAAATQAWHDANRHVIGDDADLIFPGQLLDPPRETDPS